MIRVLPPEVVNQIAAGEVIERPYSVVKELVENSLDAGATRVRVEVQGGGAECIRVVDDGSGFHAEDLPLAFASHATSKLSALADLDHIASLGFRGEALASIGSVARATIRSRRHDEPSGHEISCAGGQLGPVRPCGCPPGTTIEIRDLFFNVPARRKFLRTPASEKAKVTELLCQLSLARLDVDFTLVVDGREVLRLPGGEDLATRFGRCHGTELVRGLLPVEREFGTLRVTGLVGEPDLARRDSKLELLCVNGRFARENAAVQSVRQAYREYLMGGRIPVYVLQLVLPPDQVDVNVHPRKAEVRFLDSRRVAGCMHETVRAALQSRASASPGGIVLDPELPRARSGFPDLPADLFGRPVTPAPAVRETQPLFGRGEQVSPATVGTPRTEPAPTQAMPAAGAPQKPHPFRGLGSRFLQVMDLYLLLEGPQGLVVVDQHALHERVVYERLRNAHRARSATTQRLLVPAVVHLTPTDKEWLLESARELEGEGLLVEDFGPGAVAVQGVPAALGKVDPSRLLRELVASDGACSAAAQARETVSERFHSMACRAAVMAGDRLTEPEIGALLAEASTLEHPHNCPHGRPTVLTFTPAELERYFRRRC
ncbi:MAG: hypothetical protein RL148_2244 [Planctomycetota bacterium]